MTFEEVFAQVLDLLRRQGRVSYRALKRRFNLDDDYLCDDLGLHTLRGAETPMQVYRVLEASGVQSRLEVGTASGLMPLVGREEEVALLGRR